MPPMREFIEASKDFQYRPHLVDGCLAATG
jgi:hypothetical protein